VSWQARRWGRAEGRSNSLPVEARSFGRVGNAIKQKEKTMAKTYTALEVAALLAAQAAEGSDAPAVDEVPYVRQDCPEWLSKKTGVEKVMLLWGGTGPGRAFKPKMFDMTKLEAAKKLLARLKLAIIVVESRIKRLGE